MKAKKAIDITKAYNNSYRILAENVQISNDCIRTGLNNNDMIIGTAGTGKTRGYVIPNILQGNESMIVIDTKGNLARKLSPQLKSLGYTIEVIDFRHVSDSTCGYNPLDFIGRDECGVLCDAQDVMKLASSIVVMGNTKEPFWDYAAQQYLDVLLSYVLDFLPQDEHNLATVAELLPYIGGEKFNYLIEEAKQVYPESFSIHEYNLIRENASAEKMHTSIKGILGCYLGPMSFPAFRKLFTLERRIDLCELGRRKTVLFMNVSDTDSSQDRLVNLFFTQALQELVKEADRQPNSRLRVPVRMILDDFAASTVIPDFDKIISTIRSRAISVSLILQSIKQLEGMYGEAKACTIVDNCDNILYLGGRDETTIRKISFMANSLSDKVLNMPLSDAWLFTRGAAPRQVTRYRLENHEMRPLPGMPEVDTSAGCESPAQAQREA